MNKNYNNYLKILIATSMRYASLLINYISFLTKIRPFLQECGNRSVIIKPLHITPEYISLGNRVFIKAFARIEGIASYAGDDTFKPEIIFEDGVSLEQNCHITAASKLVIGKDTLISFNVSIQDTDHGYQRLGIPIAKQTLTVRKVKIGENCFVGSGARILGGTTLGKHCVVGANAVVRGTYPDNCVIVGAPAKIVKRYNSKTQQWHRTNAEGVFIN